MKKFFLIVCLIPFFAQSDQDQNTFGTVGNKEMLDHLPMNAIKKAKKIGAWKTVPKKINSTTHRTTVILNDGSKYHRDQIKTEDGSIIQDKHSMWDRHWRATFWWHRYKIAAALVVGSCIIALKMNPEF